MLAATLFIITYIGIALGKIPGVTLDRVGIALLGAIAMVSFGVLTPEEAFRAIDLPTILLLYSLMIISAQLRLGGFYAWSALNILSLLTRPKRFLLALMLLSALLSAFLANDIVCFAFTPVLATALLQAQLNPLPFLLGLAVASNIGSAATIIGNPQNMLIGQVGGLDFGAFLLWCGPPSLAALISSYGIILLLYRKRIAIKYSGPQLRTKQNWPAFDRWQTTKGLLAVAALIVLFFTPLPREVSAITIAGILLCSRRQKTRDILGLVDWHLITLFCALFIIIRGILNDDLVPHLVVRLAGWGIDLLSLPQLTLISTVLSNLFSNVPATMLLLPFLSADRPEAWYTLALSSTFAGNLLLLGSIANLIVAEQALRLGIRISLRDHAAIGIPVTIASLLILIVWIAL
ncbi:MAG TPA: anion transporter [Desulfobulbaceae bacterium]|nr:anion transporter [Desulfobulbaceae bacterium]